MLDCTNPTADQAADHSGSLVGAGLWYEMAMKVQREAEKTYAKPADLQQPQRQLPPLEP